MVGDLRFDALAVAAGVLHAINVVLIEHREPSRGVGDCIIAGVQRLCPQEISRRRHQRRMA
jgi:hypothetical protein